MLKFKPAQLSKPVRHKPLNSNEDDDTATLVITAANKKMLDREIRWHTFLHHSRLFAPAIIKKVFGGDADENSVEFYEPQTKIQENVRTYKSKMLRLMEEHVMECFKTNPNLRFCGEAERIQHFKDLFNADNFYSVWYYMSGVIDVDGSLPLGRYYMQSMYVNLALITVPIVVKRLEEGNPSLKDLRDEVQKVSSSLYCFTSVLLIFNSFTLPCLSALTLLRLRKINLLRYLKLVVKSDRVRLMKLKFFRRSISLLGLLLPRSLVAIRTLPKVVLVVAGPVSPLWMKVLMRRFSVIPCRIDILILASWNI